MKKSLIFFSISLICITAALSPCDPPPWVVGEFAKTLQVQCEKIVEEQETALKKFLDFIHSLPFIKQTNEFKEQLKTRPEFKILIDLLDGTDFNNFVEKLKDSNQFQQFAALLQNIENKVNATIDYDIALIKSLVTNTTDLFSIDKVKEFYAQIKDNRVFKIIADLVDGTDFKNFVEKVKSSEQYRQIEESVQDIEHKIEEYYERILNSTQYNRLKDIFDGTDFKNFVEKVKSSKQYSQVAESVQEFEGKIEAYYERILNSTQYNRLKDLLDGTDFKNFVEKVKSSEQYRQVAESVQEINDKIEAYYEQILNSPEYKRLKDLLDGTDFQLLVYRFKSSEQYQQFATYLQGIKSLYEKNYNSLADKTKDVISGSLRRVQNSD